MHHVTKAIGAEVRISAHDWAAVQMTQLTAEVKKTIEACAGIAGIAHDVQALTASLRDMENVVSMHTRDHTAAASKADQHAQTLQNTCMQVISEVQRLSAQVSASLPAHEQQPQHISKAVPAEHPHAHRPAGSISHQMGSQSPAAQKPAPAAPLQLQPQPPPQQACGKHTERENSAAMADVHGQRRRVTRSMAEGADRNNQGVHQPAETSERTALEPNRALSETQKRRRALAEQDCKQSSKKLGETPRDIEDTEPDLQATPWQTKASARKSVTQHAKAGTWASQAGRSFKRHRTPSKTAVDSSSERQARPSCPSPGPSLKLTLAPLQLSSKHNRNRAVLTKQSASPSGTAAVTQAEARAGTMGRKIPSGTGLDVFAMLFARADAESPGHVEGLPEIKEERIAEEVTKRVMMQRMRHMRI